MEYSFNVIQLNVNSIQSKHKQMELKQFINKHTPDIILLTETKLNEKNKVSFDGYNIIRNDRTENSGGGTAICYKNHLCCEFIATPNKIKSFECCLLQLKTKSEKNIIFASIYKTPSKKENGKSIQIKIKTKELDEIFKLRKDALFVVGSDFNAHHQLWNSETNTQNGIDIVDWKSKLLKEKKMHNEKKI